MSGTPNNADLTEEEQAAMLELEAQMADTDADDPLFDPSAVVTPPAGEQVEEQQEEEQEEEEQEELTPEEQQAKDDQAATDKLKADEEAAAAETEDPFSVSSVTAPRSPMLTAHAPENADELLEAIATKKAELSDKFDDGDMTSKEYQAELDKLSKDERALERAIDKAQIAQDLENQRITNERMVEINTFLKEVEIPHDPKNLRFNVLNTAVIAVANEEANANLSAREVMQLAYDLCIKEGALQAKKPAAPAPKAKTPIQAPPTLASLPASEINSTEDNRFAYLNRITDPDKREAAFNKLTAADQEAYLATGG